jgi:hypothetical protein
VDLPIYDYPVDLLGAGEPPCISLYQPTHRHHPENAQDPIRFKNLIKTAEASLAQKYPKRDVRSLLLPFYKLERDRPFWNHTLDGLAVLASNGFLRLHRLQRPVPERVVVADSFHIKPLLRILQSADRFQVLGLKREEIRLFEGNRDGLAEIPLAQGVPRTLQDALGDELTDPHLTKASYGGVGGPPMVHGHGSRDEEVDIDRERYFRAVDRAVLDHHSRPSGLPLLLASLAEHQTVFRRVGKNPFLLDGGIEIDPDAIGLEALRDRAWKLLLPRYLARLDGLLETYGAATAKGLAASTPADIGEAAVLGRIGTLLVDADQHVPGRVDHQTGQVSTVDDGADPTIDDLVDDLGELVLERGGEVIVVPAERMPTTTGMAAIFRY